MKKLTSLLIAVSLPVLALAILLTSRPTQAATTITVNTIADVINSGDGLCSLREAIIAANSNTASGGVAGECAAGGSADEINFSPALTTPAIFSLTIAGKGEDAALTGDLDIQGSTANTLQINGSGRDNTIIDGNGIDRVLDIQGGARATIIGVTIRNGDPGAGNNGGGIAARLTGRVYIYDTDVISNSASSGGGIHVLGIMHLTDSTVEANAGGGAVNQAGRLILVNSHVLSNTQGYGVYNFSNGTLRITGGSVNDNSSGGIRNSSAPATLADLTVAGNTGDGGLLNDGDADMSISGSAILSNTAASGGGFSNRDNATLTIVDSRISYNQATAGGGGISSNGGTLTVERSTIDHNLAMAGGGINHVGSGNALGLNNVTISSNTATDGGGGLYNRSSAGLNNVTLSGNSASGDPGANISNEDSLIIQNSIVANPVLGVNCINTAGSITSQGHNLDSGNSCSLAATGDITNTNPNLGPLADNGGPTWTHALLSGSQAIDNGNDASCLSTDQRGVSRPQGAACDIGAFEYAATADLSIAKDRTGSGSVMAGEAITYTITVTNDGPTTPVTATVIDTWSPVAAVNAAYAPGCTVDLVAGTATCLVTNLGLTSTVAPTPHLVLTTSAAFSGTLSNVASVSVGGGVTDLNPVNDETQALVTSVYLPPSYGVVLSADDAQSGPAGTTVTYTVTITNQGNMADTFDLAVSDQTWTTTLSVSNVALSAGLGTSFLAWVEIPAGAAGNDSDTATITATSQADGAQNDATLLTTSVPAFYDVTLSADDAQSGPTGKTITYTVTITNDGNVADSFDLAASGHVWTTTISTQSVALSAGAGTVFSVTVAIPAGALGNDSDLATITATSQTDPAKSDAASLTTTVLPFYGLDLSPAAASAGPPGTAVTYTLSITNTGNLADTFDLAPTGQTWTTTLSTLQVYLAPFAKASFTVTVQIPPGAADQESDMVTIMGASQGDGSKTDSITLTTTSVSAPVYGVALSGDSSLPGAAGTTVDYSLTITNTGNVNDTFDLAPTGHSWTTTLSTSQLYLAPSASASFTVAVQIPPGALASASDVATITATSQGDPAKSDAASLTTTVLPVYGLDLSPAAASAGPPGTAVTYTLSITNTGNLTDTFDLAPTGQTWTTTLSTAQVNLAPFAGASFTVTVQIPPGTLASASDVVSITATSQGAPAMSDAAQLTTAVLPVYGLDLSPDQSKLGAAGQAVIYTLWITNTGNATDGFNLEAVGNLWNTQITPPTINLAAGGHRSVIITVLILPGAAALDSDQVSIQVTSQHDGGVVGTAVLTTTSTGLPVKIYLPMVVRNTR